jgi:hypothetical protein
MHGIDIMRSELGDMGAGGPRCTERNVVYAVYVLACSISVSFRMMDSP